MNGPDTAPPVVISVSGQGGTQPLGTLEVAIHYPQPRRLCCNRIYLTVFYDPVLQFRMWLRLEL
jgi:hypothetical protein